MEHLFKNWEKFKEQVCDEHFLLFLDFDGTLTPIVNTPSEAHLPKENAILLKAFVELPNCQTIIITGRPLSDIKALVAINGITYVGNHGFEIEGPGLQFEVFDKAMFQKILVDIKNRMKNEVGRIGGVIIEDKGWSLCVHYRLVKEQDIDLFNKAFSRASMPFLVSKQVVVSTGKKFFELKPPIEWNKGEAVKWILSKQRFKSAPLVIYIGDDKTDEDAFYALKQDGITIRVGFGESSGAKYFLEDPDEVREFLKRILDLRKTGIKR